MNTNRPKIFPMLRKTNKYNSALPSQTESHFLMRCHSAAAISVPQPGPVGADAQGWARGGGDLFSSGARVTSKYCCDAEQFRRQCFIVSATLLDLALAGCGSENASGSSVTGLSVSAVSGKKTAGRRRKRPRRREVNA